MGVAASQDGRTGKNPIVTELDHWIRVDGLRDQALNDQIELFGCEQCREQAETKIKALYRDVEENGGIWPDTRDELLAISRGKFDRADVSHADSITGGEIEATLDRAYAAQCGVFDDDAGLAESRWFSILSTLARRLTKAKIDGKLFE
jgi:hypothetical protein